MTDHTTPLPLIPSFKDLLDIFKQFSQRQCSLILLSVDSLAKMGAIVNFAAGTAIFSSGDPDSTFAFYKSQGGHYWLDLFQDHDRVGDRMAIFDT